MSNLHGYVMDIAAENLSRQLIPGKQFTVRFFDKSNARVGEDVVEVKNIGPGETIKFETTVAVSGQPVSVELFEIVQAAKIVSLTVNSSPQGAMLFVDGTQMGTTPRMIQIGVGHHILRFAKEGFNAGTFPLDISRDDASGGSVSYELGAVAYDSIELRDGSVLTGDLVSVSGMVVEVRIGGAIQQINRNQVKRILLVQREAPKPDQLPSPVTQ